MAGPPSSSGSDTSSEDGWVDAENEAEELPTIVSLLDDAVFTDAASMVKHCKDKHGFDFVATRDRLGLDFYGCIKLINYVRQRALDRAALPAEIKPADLEDDRYLKPVLADDAFIMALDDLPESTALAAGESAAAGGEADALRSRNVELQAELDRLVRQFADYRTAVQQTLDQRWGEDEGASSTAAVSGAAAAAPAKEVDESKYYWDSYASNEIHETMLKDAVRTEAYRDFIYNNKDLFKGKVVLDIGCGTGILSMFCAKAGAKLVIAVDNSDIIDKARENIFNNGLGEQITCLKGKMEEVKLPVEQVDIIVSEWMGYCLLYEAMLPSVLWARDRYLAPDGLLAPSHTSMWVAPMSDQDWVDDHITFWRNVYGFDMKAMQEGICAESHIEVLSPRSLCGEPFMFRMLDLHTVRVEDLVFESTWRSTLMTDAPRLDAFVVWFDTFFCNARGKTVEPSDATALAWGDSSRADRVAFTTGPFGTPTHWKQGILTTRPGCAPLALTKGQTVSGKLTVSIPDDHPRGLRLKVDWGAEQQGEVKEAASVSNATDSQVWEVR
ncbi:hypothetical protein RB594_005136 [Gaeumannomyces avenae]